MNTSDIFSLKERPTMSLQNPQRLITRDEHLLRSPMRMKKCDADLGGGEILTGERDDLVDVFDVIFSQQGLFVWVGENGRN